MESNYFTYYKIEKGDNLYEISRKYNINPKLLAAINGIKDNEYIYPGQELMIPKSGYSYYITAEGDKVFMKNIFKNWTKLENSLLFGSIIIVSLIGIIYKSDLLTISCSIVGIITALLLAKGKNLGQVFGVLITILYSIVSFKNKFYGEVFIYVFFA